MKFNPRDFAKAAAVFVAMLPADALSTAVLILVALHSFLGMKQIIQSLSIITLATVLNPEVFARSSDVATVRWFVLVCCFTSWFFRSSFAEKHMPVLKIHYVVLLVVTCTSLVASYEKTISILKIAALGMGSITCLGACLSKKLTREEIESWFYNLFLVILIGNLFLLPFGVGNRPWGFVGVMNHPNAVGLLTAVNLGWLIPKVMAKNRTYLDIGMFGLSLVFIVLASARGPVFALGISLVIATLVATLAGTVWQARIQRIVFNRISLVTVVIMVGIAALNGERFVEFCVEFAMKQNEESLSDSVQDRLSGLEQQWRNIQRYPMFGIGFGIHSNPQWWIRASGRITYDPIFGLPIGASVEKGSILIALVEENGLIGASTMYVAFYLFLMRILRKGSSASLLLFLLVFAVNLSEYCLMSVGSIGLMLWLMIGLALRPSEDALKAKKPRVNPGEVSRASQAPNGQNFDTPQITAARSSRLT